MTNDEWFTKFRRRIAITKISLNLKSRTFLGDGDRKMDLIGCDTQLDSQKYFFVFFF